jgi:hypothetical protein
MVNIDVIKQKENEIISKFKEMKRQLTDNETEQNENITVSKPTRKNKKIIIEPVEVKSVDLDEYKKLLEKEQKRKIAMKKYKENQTPEQKENNKAYFREYVKANRNKEKEKEYYEKNKSIISERSSKNMKKYLAFYKLYKDKHPEFDIEFNKRDNKDKDDNDDKGSE